MTDFILWLTGKSDIRAPAGARLELVWTHRPQSWGAFLCIAAAAAVCYGIYRLYRKEQSTCPRFWKGALAATRCAALVLAGLALMGPALEISVQKSVEPYILLLLDESLSMSVKDRYRDETEQKAVAAALGLEVEAYQLDPPSRGETVDRLLRKDNNRFVQELRAKGKVKVFSFAGKTRPRETLGATVKDNAAPGEPPQEPGEPVPPLTPSGQSTNIARGIRDSAKSVAGSPMAAVVVISDGQNTSGDDPMAAAAKCLEKGAPVFAVGVGDASPLRNLRLSDLWVPENAFKGDPLLVQATLESKGMESEQATLELLVKESGAAGEGEVVAKSVADLGAETQVKTVGFKYLPPKAGKFVYTVRALPLPNELIDTDNEKSAVVNVLDEKLRVLLIAGAPCWDYQMVKNLLARDQTVDLSCWLQSMDPDMPQDGNTVIVRLPDKPEELFRYDAVVMMDPDPAEFNDAWVGALKQYMSEHAGGLLWMPGPQFATRFLSLARTAKIREVLPVEFSSLQSDILDVVGGEFDKPWPLVITAEGADHPLLQIDKDKSARDTWENMPGIYWSFQADCAKPGAQTLAEHSNPRLKSGNRARPLIVAGRYGAGRSIYLGFNGSWRWRKASEKYFDQFWIQAVRYLLEGRLSHGRGNGRLLTDRDAYSIGDKVALSATLLDAKYEPLAVEKLAVQIVPQGQDPFEVQLRPVEGKPGVYEGSFEARHLGLCEAKAIFNDGGKETALVKQFTVSIPNVEFADPRMNRELLTELAAAGGGKYFDLKNLRELPAALPDQRETIIIREKPVELWDTNRLLLLMTALLTLEWALRKRFKLL